MNQSAPFPAPCVDEAPTITDPYPVFRYVGGYNFLTQIDSAPGGNGLTVADDRAFFATLRLNGVLAKRLNGNPMEYRFEWRELPAGVWAPVPPALVARTVIGLWEQLTGDPVNPVETKEYTVNGTAGPGELVALMGADGWIRVPRESNFVGPEGYFSPNGNLVNLRSQDLVAWGSIDVAGNRRQPHGAGGARLGPGSSGSGCAAGRSGTRPPRSTAASCGGRGRTALSSCRG